MKLVSVVLDVQTQVLHVPYTYAVSLPEISVQLSLFGPSDTGSGDFVLDEYRARNYPAEVGACVLVPFGGRPTIGFIVETDVEVTFNESKIKPITAVLSKSYFDRNAAQCALWMSQRYLAPLSSCIRLFLPPACVPKVVKKDGRWQVEKPEVGEVDEFWVTAGPRIDSFRPRNGAFKQAAILDAVRQGDVRMSELYAEYGAVAPSLKTLSHSGAVTVEKRRRMRTVDYNIELDKNVKLTLGQINALAQITQAVDEGTGRTVIVDGVTGSGKTEVYLRAISHVLDMGKTAIVLVPEISLTPQTVARFRGRFGDKVAVMHSRMSAGERYDQWDFIHSGEARVVVGARSALFTPLQNVGLVVIDEEHESSYKQDSAPRYNTRDVASWMMHLAGGAIVLGSATPSISSLYRAEHEEDCTRVVLPERVNGMPLPPVTVVDMSAEPGHDNNLMFSRLLLERIEREICAGHKVVLLLNQRGFAKFLLCCDCGFVPECPNCSTSLTYHERGNILMCHHCDYRVSAPSRCPSCGSPYVSKSGIGTQRVEAELASLVSHFAEPANHAAIIRMDADTTKTRGAHQKLLEQFGREPYAILLGTQMIAKGLDFKDVTLVGVINADTQLHLPDFRAGERTFNLIQQVAGRAGRANLPGEVIVQTYEANAAPIRYAAAYDRDSFLMTELSKRQVLSYPPYVGMANILVWGKDYDRVEWYCKALRWEIVHVLSESNVSGIEVLAASPCLMVKLRNSYRWHIIVKGPSSEEIANVIRPYFRTRKTDPEVNVAVDIDPTDLF